MAQPRMKKSVPAKVQKIAKPVVKEEAQAKRPADTVMFAVGRRKTATARIRLSHGGGAPTVNSKPTKEYFLSVDPYGVLSNAPFTVTNTAGSLTYTAKTTGSGIHAQLEAVVHGLARALVKLDEAYKLPLRQHGLLTRDDRMKESRKVGQGGKARKEKQSPKR